jgi:L-threonylcarbamoyladenylate synthase
MSARFDTSDETDREQGLGAAALAIRRGDLVVVPTDTVYGVGCDAFDAEAVLRLLEAKGRGRDTPVPVLVSAVITLDALTTGVPDWARVLVDRYWPGPLTIVCTSQSSLQWDLGDTRGTVAVRMPLHDIALELIQRTGPLAVSSANITGKPAATNAEDVIDMLGDVVAVVLDAGATPGEQPSTIVDCTGDRPRILREGAIPAHEIHRVLEDTGHAFDPETEVSDADATEATVVEDTEEGDDKPLA